MQKSSWSYIIFIICIFWSIKIQAQTSEEKIPLKVVLNNLSDQHKVQFNYQSDLLSEITVFPLPKKSTLNENLKHIESETSLRFTKIGASIYTITKPFIICGYLQDVISLHPLYGATIRGEIQTKITDDKGFFEIFVNSLDEAIEIRFLGFKTIKKQARFFTLEECATISMYEEKQQIDAVVVEGYLVRGIDKKSNGTTEINFSKFTSLPGLIETDVLQTVQALPGVLSIDETVSNINIRGGSHDQNLILWDDIKMYQSGHFFGLISSFNPQITKTATVITNGTDASYSDGVSGSIQMNTDKQIQSNFEGSLGVNFISTDVFADVPLGEKSSLQIAGRRSIHDFVNTPTYNVYFDRVAQQTEIANNVESVVNSNQNFNFYDTSLRWLYNPSEKDRIRFNFILINNNLTFDETLMTNLDLDTKTSSLSQNSIAAGLSYERQWNDHFSTHFNVYNTDYKLQAINANVLQQQQFLQENVVSETGIKFKGLYKWDNLFLEAGYQFIESEVVNTNDIDVPRFLRRDSEVLREHAFFVQSQYENNNRDFSVRPGIRLNYIDKFNVLLAEPRLSIRKKLGQHFQIEALGELKHQNTSQIVNFQNDFLGVEKRRWQLTDNYSIPILKSKQASLSLQFSNKGWLVDATGYNKEVVGITSQSQSFTTKYEFTKTTGNYNILGLDFLIRKQFKNLSSWLSYSYMINEYTFNNLEDIQFPSNFDATHSFNFGTTYSNNRLNISAGLNYRTGKPTSIPLQGNEILNQQVNFDVANNTRIPEFFRVDLSAIYKLKLSKGLRTEIGASVWNALNKENTINNYYRVGADNRPIKFSRESLGLTTNFMVRFYF
ncbi:TonB-dependent receptor plug domain-containing protein [Maribacter ulvicola]|uniref:Outer membrane receptor for ferrienterochelin and colicins n=1 Tax=Maribacter ulvicola TaxID=228959 RepID=A0A1N6QDJ9_9FLAO|nr:TonB-dependent receptor plug domain-containing protein [Maribacter ulvicola]SIQ14647.1 Outer membrane receptor for ferrienterochelin and colicins [Maribacter ulvicola]